MFKKILVANRGEIAVRAFRAAYELGAKTVAVFPYEDRNSAHRMKADEAYQIGTVGHPVRAYLDVSEIIRVAKESGADAIYPGYGFLSENPELAEAAAANGITFIGPGAHVLELAGNKVNAKSAAIAAGVPVLKSTPSSAASDVYKRQDAIDPGYGFLSENPDLANACVENGITFIGPSAHVLCLLYTSPSPRD